MKNLVHPAQFILITLATFLSYCAIALTAMGFGALSFWHWSFAAFFSFALGTSFVSLYRTPAGPAGIFSAVAALIVWLMACAGLSLVGLSLLLEALPRPWNFPEALYWKLVSLLTTLLFLPALLLEKRAASGARPRRNPFPA